jgi:hypothetical protein
MFAIAPGFAVIGKVEFFLCLDFCLLLLRFHSFQLVFFVGFVKFNFGLFLSLIIVLNFQFPAVIFNLRILVFYFLQLIFIFVQIFQIVLIFSYLLQLKIIAFLCLNHKFNF